MKTQERDTLRITNQFRNRTAMVYDMRGPGTHLTVVVAPRANEHDLGDWRAEARSGGASAPALEQWGATRIESVQALGRLWAEKVATGLPSFDWEAVVKLLVDVRAV